MWSYEHCTAFLKSADHRRDLLFHSNFIRPEDAAEYEGEDWVEKLIAHYKEELDNA